MGKLQISKSALSSMAPRVSGNSLVNIATRSGTPLWLRIALIAIVVLSLGYLLFG